MHRMWNSGEPGGAVAPVPVLAGRVRRAALDCAARRTLNLDINVGD